MFLDSSLLVRAANTTFNAAVESSPMPQCNDINHCRTLQSIIYGSFSTIFLCTWTALHFSLPYPSLLTRVKWMVTALIAPEAVCMRACRDWAKSSDLLGKILENYPECGWTETHVQYATMSGFRLENANGKSFVECVTDKTIDLPKVSKDKILKRSKGDPIAKSFAVIQTAWFVFQCIHRRSQHLPLTQLEVTTLSHTLINFFIYFFWWHAPYGITVQIVVPFKEHPETIGGREDKVESEGGSSDGNDNIQVPQTTAKIGEDSTQPPISDDDPEKGLPVATKLSDEKGPAPAAYKEFTFDGEAILTVTTPQQYDTQSGIKRKSGSSQFSWYTRFGIKTFSVRFPEQLSTIRGRIILNTIYFMIGGSFGAMHCLAWNSAFPTQAGHYAWQAFSLIMTISGGTALVSVVNNRRSLVHKRTTARKFFAVIGLFAVCIYCAARVSLLILAFIQLQALPYSAYKTPSWTSFYPHIS